MTITVQGIGVVGGFGCGVQALAEALEREPAPAPERRADPAPLDRFVPRRAQRRLDPLARITALAAFLALEDAGLDPADHGRLGLVVASGHGATGTTLALIDSILEGGDACTSPIHFAGSLHNAPAAHLAILLGARGPCLSVSQLRLSAASGLLAARLWLDQGRVDRVLVGCVDELSPLSAYLWTRQGELERPLGPAGVPGEGAAFFLLSARAEAQAPYALLEEVLLGRGPVPEPPAQELLLLDGGADDLPGRRLLPLWGSTPVGPAFDLAAAALLLRSGAAGRACCLARGDEGEFGLVRLVAPGLAEGSASRSAPGAVVLG